MNGYNRKSDITKININICGNNNTIIIDGIYNSKLSIDIGNYTGVNNTNIRIGKYFESVDLSILAHQNNLNIEIGENCLFSRNIVIRGGELPHKIYDKETKTDLDNSKGITIGNHVWVGESVFIMKRARISNNTIVGCGAVVTKQFDEENVVLAGNPAKICKTNINWDKN